MIECVYLQDSYLKELNTKVTESGENYIITEKTIFYPEGGGQPTDLGTISFDGKEVPIRKVKKESGIIKHYLDGEIPAIGTEIKMKLKWDRRYAHMKYHTAQHLVAAIVLDLYKAEVAGNQINEDSSRLDFRPFKPTQEDLEKITEKFNKAVDEKKEVKIYTTDRETMNRIIPLERRKLFERLPNSITEIRIVEIVDYDIDPCAGTHIKNTEELGHIKILKTENKGADTTRIIFELI
ncbi:MAG: alanyl-tRNA editing protein [Candidatus Diapherotrites archaeon]|nr:alanyl-tRNA editing protein [Candidatus Diapherotrites archaeon]